MSAQTVPLKMQKFDPSFDQLIQADAGLEKVATGFTWTEGPVWIPEHGGYLLFANIPGNEILKFVPGSGVSVFLKPSGWNQPTPFGGKEPGSNGMTLDRQGRLVVAGHANRDVWRMDPIDPTGKIKILADRYEGKRFNSPNDIVVRRDGSIYFSDPPYGLPTQSDQDPKKELNFNGVYRIVNGRVDLLVRDLTRPNGLAFSPDEKFLYVDNSDFAKKIWMKYPVRLDGTLGQGVLFADVTSDTRDGLPDGMKVDRHGNVFSTGPGGIWIFSAEGKHLGTIEMPEKAGNLNWGGADGRVLYITASTSVYRIRVR